MSARQIDEALRLWKIRLSAAAQNLLDLQSHPVYTRISTPGANLSGETAERSALAVRTLSSLLQYFDLLQGAVSRAEELRCDMPAVFGAEEREREIAGILQGKSIRLAPVQVPFGQRSLLTSVENVDAISPPDLLTVMEGAFENVKQIVLRLEAAWESLGTSIEQALQRLAVVRARAADLNAADRLDLERAAQNLESLQDSATEDPLGAGQQVLTSINDVLLRLIAQLEELKKKREQAQKALASARNLLASLKSEHESARAAYAEARDKVGYVVDFNAGDQKMEGLIAWLDRLISASVECAPASLLVGLSNWTNAAQQALAAGRAVVSQAKHLLATRSELRGRLDALKAKARAYSLAENDELVALADQATALLYKRPTPIEDATSLVSAYEAKLNSQAKKLV